MTMRTLLGITLLVVLGAAADARAQAQGAEFENWVHPGLTFTPGIAVSGGWDSNVALAGRPVEGPTASDRIFTMAPFAMLDLNTSRTEFSVGYRGYLRHYARIEDLDIFDQRMRAALRHRVTRQLTIIARSEYVDMATTDSVELNGLPFQRVGARSNRAQGGFELRLSPYTDISAKYENTWTSFDRLEGLLAEGTIHSVSGTIRRRLSERFAVGAEGGIRRSDATRAEPRVIDFKDLGGHAEYRFSPHTAVTVGAGASVLHDSRFATSRTDPYYRADLVHEVRHATFGVGIERSHQPTFGLSGSNNTREVRGFVRVPFSRSRHYVQGYAHWRRTDPFFVDELGLDTFVTSVTVGYSLVRWMRLEGFHSYSRQDSTTTGGEVDRHRVGTQLVISQPMRIR